MKHSKEANQQLKGDYQEESNCTDVLIYDIFTEKFLRDLELERNSNNIKLENQFFKKDWQAILNFYVFSQICDAKIYPGGVTNLLKITQQHQFFPKLTEVETEMNVLLPLNKASDKLQLTFVRYTNFLVLVWKSYSITHCSKSSFFVQKFNFDFP